MDTHLAKAQTLHQSAVRRSIRQGLGDRCDFHIIEILVTLSSSASSDCSINRSASREFRSFVTAVHFRPTQRSWVHVQSSQSMIFDTGQTRRLQHNLVSLLCSTPPKFCHTIIVLTTVFSCRSAMQRQERNHSPFTYIHTYIYIFLSCRFLIRIV